MTRASSGFRINGVQKYIIIYFFSVFKVIIRQYHEPLEIIINECIVIYYYYTRYTKMQCIVAAWKERPTSSRDQLLIHHLFTVWLHHFTCALIDL